MELNKITSFKTFSELKAQKDAVQTEQDNKTKRVKSLEKISAILDELEINDMSELDEEKKKALYAKLFAEDRAEEIEDEIMAKGEEKDQSDKVGDLTNKGIADEVDEDKAEEIEDDIKKLGEPKDEDPKDGEELEAKLDEAKVTLDAMEPDEKGLVSFCKKKGIKWKVVNQHGPAGGWPEVEYIGKKKDLEEMITKFWEGDGEDSGLAEFIEESKITEGLVSIKGGRIIAHKVLNKLVDMDIIPVKKKTEDLLETIAKVITDAKMESIEIEAEILDEARSINKIQNEWSKITAEMASKAQEWKAAAADDKAKILDELKALTGKKKSLEAELDTAVAGKDKDLELAVTEGNAFIYAAAKAKQEGKEEFELNGKKYKVTLKKHALKESEETEETEEVEEGNAFGDAVKKAKEEGKKEFEFDGKTYKVEESRYNPGKFIVKESTVNEGAVKQFEMDYKDMENNIKRGIGWIDPEYVADTWENSSDSIDFELVSAEIYRRLIKAGLLWTTEDGETKDKQVKSLKELGIKESVEINEGAHGMAKKLLQSVIDGHSSRIEGIKISKKMAEHFLNWVNTSPFGKDNGNLPFYMLLKASYYWGIERGLDPKLKGELADLKSYIKESVEINEAEVKSAEEFKEYATTVLKKAFGDEYDEAKANEVIDGILKKCGDDYGACVGTLTSSLSESVVNEGFDADYWEDYHDSAKKIEKPSDSQTKHEVEASAKTWNDNNEDGADNEITPKIEKKVIELAKQFAKAKGWISSDVIEAMLSQEA